MEVRFVPPDLRKLDALRSEAMSVPFFEDERPLRGALGLVDWRTCGRVSRLILRGRLRGAADENTLIPIRPELPFEKLFLFGLGPHEAFGPETFDRAIVRMLDTLARAKVRASVLVLPGRALDLIEPQVAIGRFLDLADGNLDHDEVVLVEAPDAQKAMMPLVERARRRARADAP